MLALEGQSQLMTTCCSTLDQGHVALVWMTRNLRPRRFGAVVQQGWSMLLSASLSPVVSNVEMQYMMESARSAAEVCQMAP